MIVGEIALLNHKHMMNKINFFNPLSPFYMYRWVIISTTIVLVVLAYHNLEGGRLFTSSAGNQWSSSGPGYHK
jgi:hypothetical protein